MSKVPGRFDSVTSAIMPDGVLAQALAETTKLVAKAMSAHSGVYAKAFDVASASLASSLYRNSLVHDVSLQWTHPLVTVGLLDFSLGLDHNAAVERIEVDPNQAGIGENDLTAVRLSDFAVRPTVGTTVVAVQPEDDEPDFVSTATVIGIDDVHNLVYMAVDWDNFHDDILHQVSSPLPEFGHTPEVNGTSAVSGTTARVLMNS